MSEPTDQTGRPDTAACDEVAPYLSAYIDGELTPALQAMVTAHLATCLACARKAQRYREIGRKIASLPTSSPSPEVFERIQAAIAQRGHSPVVRESLHPSEPSPAATGVRVLSPKVVYPQEPDHDADDDIRSPSSAPARLPRTPFHRRTILLRSGIPTLVALLLIALTVALFNGLLAHGKNSNPIVRNTVLPTQVSNALNQAASQLRSDAAWLAFTPLSPTYLPAGAQFGGVTIIPNTNAPVQKSMRHIEITWTFPQQSGLTSLHLRESLDGPGWGFLGCQSASANFSGAWLGWGLPDQAAWQALTCDQNSTTPAVGQVHTEPGSAGQAAESSMSSRSGGSASADNLPPSSVGGQASIQVDLAFIAQVSNARDASSVSAAVQSLRIASLSMDSSYQQQMSIRAMIGSYSGQFLHFTAQASDGVNTYAISGQTNESAGQPVSKRREQIKITSATADVTDIVNGASAIRLDNQNATYAAISYPVRTNPLETGQDGEPQSRVIEQLLINTTTQMDQGYVWVVPTSVTSPTPYHGHTAYELAVVEAPSQTLIYIDAHTNQVIGVQMTTGVGGGGAGAPATQLTVSGGCTNMPNCSITYTELWWGAADENFSLTPAGYSQVATPATVGFQCKH